MRLFEDGAEDGEPAGTQRMSEAAVFGHVLVGFAVLPMMAVGPLLDLEMGLRYSGRLLFVSAGVLFDLNILSALFV